MLCHLSSKFKMNNLNFSVTGSFPQYFIIENESQDTIICNFTDIEHVRILSGDHNFIYICNIIFVSIWVLLIITGLLGKKKHYQIQIKNK